MPIKRLLRKCVFITTGICEGHWETDQGTDSAGRGPPRQSLQPLLKGRTSLQYAAAIVDQI